MKNLTLLFLLLLIVFIPTKIFAVETNSPNVILMESGTGRILYEKNAYETVYPASTTKILTAIITLEKCNLNDKVTASYNAIMSVPSGGSIASIKVDEALAVKDLLLALLICSGNDAANVLAEHIGGSIESFTTMMNTRAKELGAKNTNFVNPNGLHDKDHYSTAYDLAIISKYAMDNFPTFREIVSLIRFNLPITDKYNSDDRFFLNSNQLIIPNSSSGSKNYYYQYATGIKTGFTSQAKNCLVASASKDGIDLIAVILGAGQDEKGVSYRYTDCITLLDYGFDLLTKNNLLEIGTIIDTIQVKNAKKNQNTLNIIAEKSLDIVMDKSDASMEIEPVIYVDEEICAPVATGDVLGTITYTMYGKDYTVNLIAANNIEKKEPLFIGFINVISKPFLFFIILATLLFFVRLYNKSRNKRRRARRAYTVYNSRFK